VSEVVECVGSKVGGRAGNVNREGVLQSVVCNTKKLRSYSGCGRKQAGLE
jgi:hypothetical protein